MSIIQSPPSRDLTPQEQEARAKLCFGIEKDIKGILSQGRYGLWELGSKLYEFNEQNGWTALGHDSQAEWLAQPDIGITKWMFSRLVRRHKEMVINRQLPQTELLELEPSKLDIVLPVIEATAKPITGVLDDVKTLGARDLREKYFGSTDSSGSKATGKDDDGSANGDAPGDANGHAPDPEEEARAQRMADLAVSAGHVDSWVELGGDKRKARRHFLRLLEDHPAFQAMHEIERTLDGVEGSISREDLAPHWATFLNALGVTLPT